MLSLPLSSQSLAMLSVLKSSFQLCERGNLLNGVSDTMRERKMNDNFINTDTHVCFGAHTPTHIHT